jgi:hypothetical protein
MKNMKQLYMHIDDMIPTETREEVEAIGDYQDWLESVKDEGILYQLHVDHAGYIRDGNGRYWIAKELGIQWLPVSIQYFLAIQYSTESEKGPHYEMNLEMRDYITNKAYTIMRPVESNVKKKG